MPQITVQQVSFGYGETIFERLELTCSPGCYALVGPNGGGKSTLLNLLTGRLVPQRGQVRWIRCDHRVLCEQAVDVQSPEVVGLGSSCSGGAMRLRAQLRLDAARLAGWDSLSPGERKRWQIAAALHSEPDFLALDEPTNHLDLEARKWVIEALRAFRGIAVAVSHDRDFMDALCDTTWRLESGRLTVTPGNYSAAERTWLREQQTITAERRELGRLQRALGRAAQTSRAEATAAEKQRNAGRRMKSIKDHDASCILHSNQAESAGRRLARQARSIEARRERVASQLDALPKLVRLGSELFADFEPAAKSSVLRGQVARLSVGEREILLNATWHLQRGQRVWLTGPNGAGKSTFLEHVTRSQADPRVLYLPQNMHSAQREAVRLRWLQARGERRSRQMTLVAALGTDPDVLLRSRVWSEGELRKVALSLGLADRVHTLVLDEPTNHLDLPSVQRLERLLTRFPGSVLLATHDLTFAQRVTLDTWRIEGRDLVGV
jgi:ATPase subunit of ABC transporter with duplicated ATPase domains